MHIRFLAVGPPHLIHDDRFGLSHDRKSMKSFYRPRGFPGLPVTPPGASEAASVVPAVPCCSPTPSSNIARWPASSATLFCRAEMRGELESPPLQVLVQQHEAAAFPGPDLHAMATAHPFLTTAGARVPGRASSRVGSSSRGRIVGVGRYCHGARVPVDGADQPTLDQGAHVFQVVVARLVLAQWPGRQPVSGSALQ